MSEQQCLERLAIKSLEGIEYFTNLEILDINCTTLENLSLSNHPRLTYLDCAHNQLVGLDIASCTGLDSLFCEGNHLTSLDVKRNAALTTLHCGDNKLWRLVVSSNTTLVDLSCRLNRLRNLDISNNDLLEILDISEMPALGEVCVRDTLFPPESITIAKNGSPNVYFSTNCFYNQFVFIPDSAFFTALVNNKVDANGDGLISYAEAEAITFLNVSWMAISDMTGIEAFVNLYSLDCSGNHLINSLDVSNNLALKYLNCSDMGLTTLDVSKLVFLEKLWLWINDISTLDVSNNPALITLDCRSNRLATLDLSNQPGLRTLFCVYNQLSSLDLSINTKLRELWCSMNQLTNLDVSKNTALELLWCEKNLLTTLDVSHNTALRQLKCGSNQLVGLDVSKNTLRILEIGWMPTLSEVCVRAKPFPPENVTVSKEGSPNVYFKDCVEPVLYDVDTILSRPEYIEAKSSEDGMIYLVPENTEKNLAEILKCLIISKVAIANTAINVPVSGLGNGKYWLYAIDLEGNISEPTAFSILAVGITKAVAEQIRIFPNPANNLVTLQTWGTGMYFIEICSMNGKIIHSSNFTGDTYKIDLSTFQMGIYIITVRSKDQLWRGKIIKLSKY